jgi:hypothetical protein
MNLFPSATQQKDVPVTQEIVPSLHCIIHRLILRSTYVDYRLRELGTKEVMCHR